MRLILIAAAAVCVLLSGNAKAEAQFCGVRYCSATVSQPAKYRAIGYRVRHVSRPHRHEQRHREVSRPVQRPATRPVGLLAFTPPPGALCAAAGELRRRLAEIVEPVRPGFVWIRSASGARAIVAQSAADRFVGLLRDLEATGYRVAEMGGYAYRRIAGTRHLSKHAFGHALDINQEERDRVSIRMNRAMVSRLAAKNGLCSGGDWRHPDLGHFEMCGRNRPTAVVAIPRAAVVASADPDAPLAEPPPAKAKPFSEKTIASVFNDRRTACPPYHPDRSRLEVAHRTLACGTRVKITNLLNGRTAEAVVADVGPCTTARCLSRTPLIAKRHLDLRPEAAAAVGARRNSLTPVRYSVVR